MRGLIRPEGIDAVHGEKLNEPRAGAMDPALDRSYRALADGGGLLVGEARRADENERFALVRQELRERPADRFVPGSNESIFVMARSKVSCTRSSARSTLRLSEIANARKLGTAASMASRTDG